MHRTTFQATSVLFFFVVNWSKVGPYYWLGQWTTDNLLTSLVLLPLAPVGVSLGRYLHDRVDDELFSSASSTLPCSSSASSCSTTRRAPERRREPMGGAMP